MWFKNLIIFRLPKKYAMDRDHLELVLGAQSFLQCPANEMQSHGWASPRGDDQLVHAVNKQFLLMLATESKLLPGTVITQVAKAKAAEIEEQQGFAPGRKQMKEIKEQVTDELLPRAFSIKRNTYVWVDPVNGWLIIDSSSPSKADEVIKLLLKADKFPLESLRVKLSPLSAMTNWLDSNESPKGFTIDQDADLKSHTEDRATVRYVHHTLDASDVQRHIAAGKQCTKLAMTWDDKISFVLTDTMSIKRIKPLDILDEDTDNRASNADERFDADFILMASEIAKMLDDIVFALGGEADDLVSSAQKEEAKASESVNTAGNVGINFTGESGTDELYDQAVTVVRSHQRASIAFVQRHLLIGYNRAARLIEQMEAQGIVSAMKSDGNRQILKATA